MLISICKVPRSPVVRENSLINPKEHDKKKKEREKESNKAGFIFAALQLFWITRTKLMIMWFGVVWLAGLIGGGRPLPLPDASAFELPVKWEGITFSEEVIWVGGYPGWNSERARGKLQY